MKSRVAKINLILIAIIILLVGFWVFLNLKIQTPVVAGETGVIYSPPRKISEFQLIDLDNNVITESRFKGKWWLAYFGFTYCPDACPMALSDMKKIKAAMDDQVNENTDFVFISVDPNRDTPQRLREYVQYYDPEFYAATGEAEELKRLADSVGVAFSVPEAPQDENYVVGHSTFMLLINPRMELEAVFRVPHHPEAVAHGISNIQKYFNPL